MFLKEFFSKIGAGLASLRDRFLNRERRQAGSGEANPLLMDELVDGGDHDFALEGSGGDTGSIQHAFNVQAQKEDEQALIPGLRELQNIDDLVQEQEASSHDFDEGVEAEPGITEYTATFGNYVQGVAAKVCSLFHKEKSSNYEWGDDASEDKTSKREYSFDSF